MTASLGTVSVLSIAPPVLVTLVACVCLLGMRAWAATTGVELSRRVFLLLDGAIVALVVLFVALVTVRFLTGG